MAAVIKTHQVWNRRISTGRLNRWLEGVLAHHPPPAVAGRRLKIKYITQAKTRPPGFVVSCSRPDAMPQSYVRYLVNGLRETFDMPGVPDARGAAHLRKSVRRQGQEARLNLQNRRTPPREPTRSSSWRSRCFSPAGTECSASVKYRQYLCSNRNTCHNSTRQVTAVEGFHFCPDRISNRVATGTAGEGRTTRRRPLLGPLG